MSIYCCFSKLQQCKGMKNLNLIHDFKGFRIEKNLKVIEKKSKAFYEKNLEEISTYLWMELRSYETPWIENKILYSRNMHAVFCSTFPIHTKGLSFQCSRYSYFLRPFSQLCADVRWWKLQGQSTQWQHISRTTDLHNGSKF